MNHDSPGSPASSGRHRRAWAFGLIGGGVVAGAIFATALGANASTAGTGSTVQSTQAGGHAAPSAPAGGPKNQHGAAPARSDEKALSASDTARLKAAALKAVPGGTVYRVETDAGDGTYEAHMTKANGTEVTVKFDKSFAVTKIEQGMGAGDPAPTR